MVVIKGVTHGVKWKRCPDRIYFELTYGKYRASIGYVTSMYIKGVSDLFFLNALSFIRMVRGNYAHLLTTEWNWSDGLYAFENTYNHLFRVFLIKEYTKKQVVMAQMTNFSVDLLTTLFEYMDKIRFPHRTIYKVVLKAENSHRDYIDGYEEIFGCSMFWENQVVLPFRYYPSPYHNLRGVDEVLPPPDDNNDNNKSKPKHKPNNNKQQPKQKQQRHRGR